MPSLPRRAKRLIFSDFLRDERATESDRDGSTDAPTFPRARRAAVSRACECARGQNRARTNRPRRSRRASRESHARRGEAGEEPTRHRAVASSINHRARRADLGDETRGVGRRCESGASARWDVSETLRCVFSEDVARIASVPMAHNAEAVLELLDKLDVKTISVSKLAKIGICIDGLSDDMDEKERDKVLRMYRRKIANRESAKRSKIRKKAEDAKLLSAAETLLNDSASMRQTIKDLQRKVDELYAENVKLRRRLGEEVNDELEQTRPSVNLPPEVETPSLVMKEARKKKRGMMKSRSDSSIATTFGEEFRASEIEDLAPTPKRGRVEQTASEVPKQTPLNTQIDENKLLALPDAGGCSNFILENFLMQEGQRMDVESPFLTDNFAMYDFKEGEIVQRGDFSSFF